MARRFLSDIATPRYMYIKKHSASLISW